jgi:hypothetical protein
MVLLLVATSLCANGAGPDVVWQKTFGGSKNDVGNSVQQTSDGGYIIAGSTESFGAGRRDVYLIKTDARGNLVWQKTFGGRYDDDDGNSVQQTSDGGYIIAGTTAPSIDKVTTNDVYLIKTDGSGNLVWEKTFEGTWRDVGNSVQQTSDGGYIIAGETRKTFYSPSRADLIKTDANGNLVWRKAFGEGDAGSCGKSVLQTSDGGYIIAGETGTVRETDIYLVGLR